AKLGRWHDSKRTSSPGWVVMWDGWFSHQDMAEGYLVMKSLDQEICSRDRSKMGDNVWCCITAQASHS
ncbi:TPA: hypothetical protein ACNFJY_004676, partial [Escherichia coli]